MKSSYSIYGLRVNELETPLGIDDDKFFFSWKIDDADRGEKQLFYRIVVASSAELLTEGIADQWDSGKQEGDPLRVAYEGGALGGGCRYWWKVESWNKQGSLSASSFAYFDTGLRQRDWKASWIWKAAEAQLNDFAYFRKETELHKPVTRAKIFVSAHNSYQLFVNGTRIGGCGSPAPSHPRKRKYYLAYDVSGLLVEGPNCLTAIVHYLGGDGQNYVNGLPGFLLQMEILYADGTRDCEVTDPSWETLDVIPHAIGTPFQQFRRLSAIEDYDATKLPEHWMDAGFPRGFTSGAVIAPELQSQAWLLKWQQIPEGIEERLIVPVATGIQEVGCQVFDAGLIVSGWPRISLSGIAGVSVQLRYSEDLDEAGHVKHNVTNEPSEFYYDRYTMRGAELETWAPDFSYKAFRYVEITGYPERLSADQLVIVSAHTAIVHEGSFNSSDELLNRIYDACIQTQKNNTLGLLADCPHREQAQFLADADLQAETLLYQFGQSYPVLEKVLSDFSDGQRENGTFPWVFPSSFDYPGFSGWIPEWDLHYCSLLWKVYEWSHHLQLLQTYYVPAKRMLDFYLNLADAELGLIPKSSQASDWHISDHPYQNIDQNGDFLTVQNIKIKHIIDLVGNMALALGYENDASYMRRRSQQLQEAILKHLYRSEQKQFADCYMSQHSHQGTNVVAYQYGIVPPEHREEVLESIISGGLDCRTLLALNLLRVLFDNGAEAEAYRLIHKTDQPGWGYMIEQGSRTIWEGFNDMESHCHAWNAYPARLLVEYLVGIQMAAPGWNSILIKPFMPEGITFMEGSVVTSRGRVTVRWETSPGSLLLDIDIPPGSTADVVLPLRSAGSEWVLTESGQNIGSDSGVAHNGATLIAVEINEDCIVIGLESGSYWFEMHWK
ncbi:alpha-L-rhamnosidase [Paenibacillus sp. PAMC21692]|uniref:alpha-L-rhamnosidase n=1 Tax=Paenibacillus sp. PAMC21692 TaxID=2762320 RepID=UPI00164D8139|nr:alpha-L-rhamnosidase [Paenibacillus sp. PAMC21692]QNK60325.1 family 78 glycoside hydrolase catalytic domain [Paenibacillus sp. PAMC21692]